MSREDEDVEMLGDGDSFHGFLPPEHGEGVRDGAENRESCPKDTGGMSFVDSLAQKMGLSGQKKKLNKRGLSAEECSPPKKTSLALSETQRQLLLNRYLPGSRGPFLVHVETCRPGDPPTDRGNPNLESGKSSASLSVIGLGKRLNKLMTCQFMHAHDLRSIGRNKFSVCFPSADCANSFVDRFKGVSGCITQSEVWTAHVPSFRVVKQYVLRGVDDAEETAEDVVAGLRPPPEVDGGVGPSVRSDKDYP